MGCCSSVPENESKSSKKPKASSNKKSSAVVKPEVTITGPSSSSVNLSNGEKSEDDSSNKNKTNNNNNSKKTWPIFVRLSHNGQDIKIEAPIKAPYLTVASIGQQLTPHLKKYNNGKNNVKLIYLGRILNNKQTIVPTVTDEDTPLPPPTNTTLQIQKNGVIQAMITKT